MASKVFAKNHRVMANIAKVYGFTATSQELKSIEAFEKKRRWLVDSAKDGLTVIS